jgi:cytochrome c oxidase subunit 1
MVVEVSPWHTVTSLGEKALTAASIAYALLAGKKAAANPWGEGATTLEWTLPSPPPYHQFETLPVITDAHDYHDHRPATA